MPLTSYVFRLSKYTMLIAASALFLFLTVTNRALAALG